MKTGSGFSKNTIALAAICLAALMFGLEISSVPVILPTLEKVLHGNFRDMQWIMNAYTIACTTVLMAIGALADRYGRKRVFVISLVLFGITSLICGLAQRVGILVIGRLLQGAGGGAMLICQIAILSHQFRDGRERSRAFSIWGVVFGIGLGFGPIIGGLIVAVSSWQWVFLVHVVITIVTLLLVSGSIRESADPHAEKVDIIGIITLSATVLGLSYYITQGPEIGFSSAAGIGVITLAALSFIIFLIAEKRVKHPMFDFSVFRISRFSGALLGSMGMNFSFWPFMIYLPIYFQSGLGYDAVTAGMALLAYTLPTLVFPPVGERLAMRYNPGVVIPWGMLAIGIGFLLMKTGSAAARPGWQTMLPGLLIAGAGLGIINTPVTNTTTGAVSSDRAGMASGIDMSARMIALAVNIALMGFILIEGILYYLKRALPDTHGPLHQLAEKIASGSVNTAGNEFPELAAADPSGKVVHDALVHGFGLVMLYGGTGIIVLAVISFVVFRQEKKAAQVMEQAV
ncbi:MAG TPA: MFS transporter [Chitinophaga sp.]|uniref:MFS transporter n=1 Tax=Chitinophaga sp. TaxID=1869181 RepID=UPI002BA65057|nr:MFS transporter [Chitinophaga sp.]HVI44982.1 MFS transporter [Chitinophaga sp.]